MLWESDFTWVMTNLPMYLRDHSTLRHGRQGLGKCLQGPGPVTHLPHERPHPGSQRSLHHPAGPPSAAPAWREKLRAELQLPPALAGGWRPAAAAASAWCQSAGGTLESATGALCSRKQIMPGFLQVTCHRGGRHACVLLA